MPYVLAKQNILLPKRCSRRCHAFSQMLRIKKGKCFRMEARLHLCSLDGLSRLNVQNFERLGGRLLKPPSAAKDEWLLA